MFNKKIEHFYFLLIYVRVNNQEEQKRHIHKNVFNLTTVISSREKLTKLQLNLTFMHEDAKSYVNLQTIKFLKYPVHEFYPAMRNISTSCLSV